MPTPITTSMVCDLAGPPEPVEHVSLIQLEYNSRKRRTKHDSAKYLRLDWR